MAKESAGRAGTGDPNRTYPGRRAERFAARYLQQRGLKLVARNWHCRYGEIDLVCLEGDCVVFAEVKHRRGDAMVAAEQCLNRAKLNRLLAATQSWIARYDPRGTLHARIDLLAINGSLCEANTEWIKNLQPNLEPENG